MTPAESQSRTDSLWPDGKTVIPWLEVNVPTEPLATWPDRPRQTADADSPPEGTALDYCLKGVRIWAEVTQQAIISTKPGRSEYLYKNLMQRKPDGFSIIGGLKTYILKGTAPKDHRTYDFADPVGWRRIAEESRKIVEITGVNVVVLECETAWEPHQEGRETIDLDRLRKSLAPLRETGIQFWWNPVRIMRNTPTFRDREAQTAKLVATIVEALPDSMFLTSYTAWHGWKDNLHDQRRLRERMIDLVGQKRLQERLLVTVDGRVGRRRAYNPAEALEMIAGLPGDHINVYPTGPQWVEVASQFRKMLRPPANRGGQ